MTPETRFEAKLTRQDKQFLKSIKVGIGDLPPVEALPQPMVSVEQYVAMVDANEYVTRENWRLRRGYRRLLRKARSIQKSCYSWRSLAIAGWVCVAVLGVVIWRMR